MNYYINSPITREIIESGILNFYLGELLVWDIPCEISPINNTILLNYIKEKFPKISMNELYYQLGKMQSHRGNKIMIKKFGFKKDKKLMVDSFGKSEILGTGIFEFLEFDLKNKKFTVINPISPYANQYLKMFGKRKNAVCHHQRGLCAGSFQAFFEDTEMVCIETSCIAKGDKACIFTIKPKNQWNTKNPIVKKQLIKHKIPKKIFEHYYNVEKLESKNSRTPKNKNEILKDKKRIREIIDKAKKTYNIKN
jgi:predicted hydrocarbon binding protein